MQKNKLCVQRLICFDHQPQRSAALEVYLTNPHPNHVIIGRPHYLPGPES